MSGNWMRGVKFFVKNPFWLLVTISGIYLFLGLAQLHTNYVNKAYDFKECTGEIVNVTPKEVFRHGQYVIRYSYDLRWYADGEVFWEHYGDQVESMPEGEVSIWVRSDNRDVMFVEPGKAKQVLTELLVALVAGLLAALLYWRRVVNRKETPEERLDRLENNQIAGMIGFMLCLFGIGLVAFDMYRDYQAGKIIATVCMDMLIAFIVIAAICLIIFFVSKKESRCVIGK